MTTPEYFRVGEAQKAIEAFSNNLKCTKWEAQLPFTGSTLIRCFESELEYIEYADLLQFCNPKYKGLKVYFNPLIYPPPSANTDNAGIDRLRVDLERAAHKNGYSIISNGKRNSPSKVFLCQSFRAHNS